MIYIVLLHLKNFVKLTLGGQEYFAVVKSDFDEF